MVETMQHRHLLFMTVMLTAISLSVWLSSTTRHMSVVSTSAEWLWMSTASCKGDRPPTVMMAMDCYHSDVNRCDVMVMSTATMLWRRSLLLPSNGSDKCFPCRCGSDVVASCPVVKSGVAYSSVVGTGMSAVVLLRQRQQLISGYEWELNCCPVVTTKSTDFRLRLGCQLLSCCDNNWGWFTVMT
jgi:hypothetical protein